MIICIFMSIAFLKSCNEAVVESQGSIVDLHADPRRGLSQESYAMESMVHWNGPNTVECEQFLIDSLNLHFGKGNPWHFTSFDSNNSRVQKFMNSAVIDRLKKETGEFPFVV